MKLGDPADTGNPKLADFLCFAIYSANLTYGRAYRSTLPRQPARHSAARPLTTTPPRRGLRGRSG